MKRAATFSPCRKYRYTLTRKWNLRGNRIIIYVGLNPSDADEAVDDRLVKKCIEFSKIRGADGLMIVNLYAYVSPYPETLKKAGYPIGPKNDQYLSKILSSNEEVIVCWGNLHNNQARVSEILRMITSPLCFGKTILGNPKHPSRIPYSTAVAPF